jgi:MYXO-CTERM domain-containing protein
MVTSNIMNDARGDGATSVRKRLRPLGASEEVSAATASCQLVNPRPAPPAGGSLAVLFVLAAWRLRRRAPRNARPAL